MNNTKTLAIVAIFMAATLVVGTLTTTTTVAITQSAFAYKKDSGNGNGNGNTVTIEECKNRGSASGFDTTLDQECENLICTHPGNNANCVQEGAVSAAPQTPVKLTCEQCFTKFLNSTQITVLLIAAGNFTTLGELCAVLPTLATEAELVAFLESLGVSESAAIQLIQCLKDAGIVFPTEREVERTLR